MKRTLFLCACALAVFHTVVSAQVPARSVNMVSGTTLPDGDPFLQRQNEPSAAVSTRNPLHLLAGANDYRTVDIPGLPDGAENGDAWLGIFKSTDGGQTWRSTLIPGYPQDDSPAGRASPLKGYQAAADPTVRSGTNGLFYYSGIAFDRGPTGKSAVFVSRFIDNNNVAGGDPIALLDTTVVDAGNQAKFIDKPYIAVDIPRPGGPMCTIRSPGTTAPQTIPAGAVYLAYQVFSGTETAPTSRLMLSRSLDCGATWSKPLKVKDLPKTNQGVQIAIAPATGEVYLTWRAFADAKLGGDAVLFSKSEDVAKLKFKDSIVFPIKPYDQGTSATSFRTNSYPTIAVDGTGRIYLTWTERGYGPPAGTSPANPTLDPGDARVVMTTSRDGVTWTPRQPIENNSTSGHQIMPVVTAIGGKISVLYYDLREDVSKVFKVYIDDNDVTTKRHTLDLRILQADPGDTPLFDPSVRVSEYMFGVLPGGSGQVEQLQFNVPNLPLFAQGSAPFLGDFIDLTGETFAKDAAGKWTFNTNGSRTVHAFWTDNRDVRAPKDGNWKNYTPPTSLYTQQVCTPGQTGMRNSNIYTSRITPGLRVGAPGNTKQLLFETKPADRRSFVVFAQNNTDQTRLYRFTIMNQPPGGTASFLQFSPVGDPLTTLETAIAPRSTSSRTVYVSSSDPAASVNVDISEIQAAGGTTSLGLTASLTLNPDRTNPTVTNPTVTNAEEFNPTVTNPTVTNPTVTNPTVTNPTVTNPTVTNVVLANPTVTNPTVTNPTVTNPTVTNPTVTNTEMVNAILPDGALVNGVLTDTTWTVKNEGNVAGSFSVKTLLTKEKVPEHFKTHLLIYKTYTTPVTLPNDCEIKTESQMQLVSSIPNPTVTNPTVTNPTVTNEDVTNPTVTNASLWLDVGEEAKITFRVLNPDKTQTVEQLVTRPNGDVEKVLVSPEFNVEQVVAPVVTPTTVDTVDAAAGVTTVEVVAPLIVTTTVLADGIVGFPYSAQLTSVGGVAGGHTWTLVSGALPAGLQLSSAGVISGTSTVAGSFAIELQATDTATPAHIARADLILRIAPSTQSTGLTTPEDQALTIVLSAGGFNNGSLVFATTAPAHGTLTGTAPNVVYTPDANFNGTDSFTFTATIAGPAGPVITSPPATVSINVTPVNDSPVAANDTVTTSQNTPISITVLANDTDLDNDALTLDLFTQPSSGQVSANSSGVLTYTPTANFAGSDAFTYRVRDVTGTLSGYATVEVTVNATGAAIFVVTNTNDSGPGSLRAAILNANANPASDSITFNIAGAAPHTIAPLSALPDVTGSTVIDGTTQPGFSSAPVIELNGEFAGAGADGLAFAGGSSTVRGLVINRFARMGVYLKGGAGHHVEGSYIGVDVAGTAARPNGEHGIGLGTSSGNTIGGTTPFTRNVISGNGLDGIGIFGAGINTILGNYVGTDWSGATAVPNGRHGILVEGAGEVAIGNGTPAGRNLISGNTEHGVALTLCFPPASCNGNLVTGNFIGTNAAATAALPNHRNGVNIHNSPRNVIRGNVISGNGVTAEAQFYADGIGVFAPRIEDDPLSELHFGGQVIAGNKIGTDLGGTNPIPNLRFGVFLNGLTKTTVGGGTPQDPNLIAFNLQSGVDIGWSTSNNNLVRGNTIRSNGGAGVVVRRGTRNRITGNAISANAGLGISLDADGGSAVIVPNDTGDADAGPNDLQNFPVITAAITNAGSTTVSGSLDSTPTTTFTLEFFASPAADPTGYGEGQMFVGSTVITTDTTGHATFNTTIFVSGLPGQIITATATDAAGNTSEFSQARLVPPVITTNFLPNATRNSPYSQTLTASGATGATTWALIAGSLPAGLSLDATTGTISGTPNPPACGFFNFTVQVTDSAVPTPQTASRPLSLSVTGSIVITTTALPIGVTFENYTPFVNTSCGNGSPRTWSLSGALPIGVGFNTSTGQFAAANSAGVTAGPRQSGTFPLVIQVSDLSGSDSKNLTLHVTALDQQVSSGAGTAIVLGGTTKIAQTITVGASGTLAAVRAALSPVAPATSCTVKVSIEGLNPATGAPDDSQVFGSTEATLLSGGGARTVGLPGVSFSVDARFAVVFSASDTASATSCQMNGPSNFDNYSGGAGFVKSGGAWTQPSDNGGDVQVDTLIHNPALSSLTKSRSVGAQSVTLNNGKVLIIGTDGTAELFDPATGESTLTANTMQTGRENATVTQLSDGKVLVLGGSRFLNAVPPAPTIEHQATGETYDPVTNTFTPLSVVMAQGRSQHSATLLRCPASNPTCWWKDTVLVAGGFGLVAPNTTPSTLQSAEIFDPAANAFIAAGAMATPRNFHAAAGLADGRVLVAGGFGVAPFGTSSEEIFDAAAGPFGSFAPTGSLITPRARATATLLNNGKVLVAGGTSTGNGPPGPLASAELFDPSAGTNGAFTSAGTMLSRRQQHSATTLPDGSVLLAGGIRSAGFIEAPAAAAERYVPAGESFTGAPSMLVVRADHGAALLPDGRIAVTGGNSNPGASRQSSRTIEVYDPGVLADGTVAGTPSIANPNLPDGFVGASYGPYALHGVGGTATPYVFTLVAPTALPPGITLSTAGVFTGSPTAPGTYVFDVLVSDAAQPTAHSSRRTLRIRVNALTIVGSLPTAYLNRPYSAPLLALPGFPELDGAGGVKPYTWTTVFGTTLPSGLSIDAVTNTLIGNPNASGSHFFTLKVVDGAGQSAIASLSLFVGQPLTITTTTLHDGVLRESYFGCFGWEGNYAFPLTWTISPQAGTELPGDFAFLPNSSCLDGSTDRQITKTGTFSFTVRATDSGSPAQYDEKTYTIRSHAQEQLVSGVGGTDDVPLTPTRRVAQVITASTPFALTGVQLWGISSCSTGMTITADVRPVIGAPARPDENGPPLATASATADFAGFFNSTLTFAPVAMAQHAQFAIVISFAGTGSCRGVNWPAYESYNAGHALVSDNNTAWQLMIESSIRRTDVQMNTLTMPIDLSYLSTYRASQTAVTLSDTNKRVLILGNDATAEIYDPVAKTLTPTDNNMSVARSSATATLLSDGKVLVAGGYSFTCPPAPAACTSTAVDSIELFDPASNNGKGRFVPAGTLNVGRYSHAATLLADDASVLLSGGYTGSGSNFQITQTAEIWRNGTVSAPLNMRNSRVRHTATLIPSSSKVLVAGGWGDGPHTAEIFDPGSGDPALGTFTPTTGSMTFRAGHTATALTAGAHQGQILLTGGSANYPDVTGTTEFFTLATTPAGVTSTFAAGPPLRTPRIDHAAVALADGRVVVLGGNGSQTGQHALSDVEIAGPDITEFTRAGDLLVDRTWHTASLTGPSNAQQIVVAGGYSTSWLSARSLEVFTPPSAGAPALLITTPNLPDGAVGVAYSLTPIAVTGATGALQFSIPWGHLPSGLSLTSNGISGTPQPGTGGVHSFVVQVTDSALPAPRVATRAFTITVNRLTFMSPAQLPSAAPSQPYSYQLQATGVGVVSFTIEPGGALPPDFSVTPAGLISFSPTGSGFYFVTIRARDTSGQSIVKGFNINVAMPLAITTSSLADAAAPWFYGGCVSWTGGAGAVSFTPPTGLPYGLALESNGCFDGRPQETGSFTLGVEATDQSVPPQQASRTLSLRVGTADQAHYAIEQPAPPGIAFGAGVRLAQVLTPGMSGSLLYIQMPVACTNGGLRVEIQRVSGGKPDSTTLASTDVDAASLGSFQGAPFFRRLPFAVPAFVTRGVPVAAVLITTGSCTVASMPASVGPSYPGGDGFWESTPGNWTPLSVNDPLRPDLPFEAVLDEGGRLRFMVSHRNQHTETLLTTGDYAGLVLLTGGYGANNATELFNPSPLEINGVPPGRFAPGPPMNAGRVHHTATMMPDGSIIVIGGIDTFGTPQQTAERLDPQTFVWSTTGIGPMLTPRFAHTTTLLGNGRLLIAGGHAAGWSSSPLATTELLVPGSPSTFVAGPALAAGRTEHSAVSLNDGRVLVTGGWGVGAAAAAELYHYGDNAFTAAGPLQYPRVKHATALLAGSGKVLLVGGTDPSNTASVQNAEIFNPSDNTFTAIFANEPREGARTVRLSDGRILIMGGTDHAGTPLASTSLFDPATLAFTAGSDLIVARAGFTASYLSNNNRVLIAGGCCGSHAQGISAEVFDVAVQALAPGLVNTSFTTPGIVGGSSTYAVKSGTLPPGLTLNPATGAITGTATVAGVYRFVIEITSAAGHKTLREMTIQINGPLTITTATLSDGVVGVGYSAALSASGGSGPRSWTSTTPLPPGLSLSPDGVLAGTPSAPGAYTFTVDLIDSAGFASRSVTLIVDPPWTTTFPEGGFVQPGGFSVDPDDSQTLYAVLNWRGIHKSINGGATWTALTDAYTNPWPFDRTAITFLKVMPGSHTFYVLSGGRPFRSVDQGRTWIGFWDGLGGYPHTLAIDSTGTVYAGTSVGVFKSVNGGTWQHINNGLPSGPVVSLAVAPGSNSTVYAGSYTAGLYKTTDGGATWSALNNYQGVAPLALVLAIKINPLVPSVVYAAGRDTNGDAVLIRGTSGGATLDRLPGSFDAYWQWGHDLFAVGGTQDNVYIGSGGRIAMWVNGQGPAFSDTFTNTQISAVAVGGANVYAGTNGAGVFEAPASSLTPWAPRNTNLRGRNFPHSFAHSVHFDQSDPLYVYAGAINGSYRSVDAGQTWQTLALPMWSASTLMTHPSAPGILYAFQDQLHKSADRGQSWTNLTAAVGSWNDGDIALDPNDPSTIYLATGGAWQTGVSDGVYKSTNGGGSWQLMNNGLPTPSAMHALAVHPQNGSVVFAATQGGGRFTALAPAQQGIYRTTDGGLNWTQLQGGLPATGLNVNQIVIHPLSPNIMYAGAETTNGGIYKSTDGGNTWTRVLAENVNTVVVDPTSTSLVYAGTWNTNGFYRSRDAGATWTTFNAGLPIEAGIESIAVDAANPRHLVLGTTAGAYHTTFSGGSVNLQIAMTVDSNPATLGDPLIYTITVQNGSPGTATAVTMIAPLPAWVAFSGMTSTRGSCSHSIASNVVTCALGTLPSSDTATVTVTTTPVASGQFSTTATVSSAQGDSNPTDNSATKTVTAEAASEFFTPTVGGGGGTPFTMSCPSGSIVTALKGRAGDDIDRTELWCSALTPNGWGTPTFVAVQGGSGGNAFDQTCAPGSRLTGLHGRAGMVNWGGPVVDTIGAICTNPLSGAETVFAPAGNVAFQNGTPPTFRIDCPAGRAVIRIVGGQGGLLDRIGLVCR